MTCYEKLILRTNRAIKRSEDTSRFENAFVEVLDGFIAAELFYILPDEFIIKILNKADRELTEEQAKYIIAIIAKNKSKDASARLEGIVGPMQSTQIAALIPLIDDCPESSEPITVNQPVNEKDFVNKQATIKEKEISYNMEIKGMSAKADELLKEIQQRMQGFEEYQNNKKLEAIKTYKEKMDEAKKEHQEKVDQIKKHSEELSKNIDDLLAKLSEFPDQKTFYDEMYKVKFDSEKEIDELETKLNVNMADIRKQILETKAKMLEAKEKASQPPPQQPKQQQPRPQQPKKEEPKKETKKDKKPVKKGPVADDAAMEEFAKMNEEQEEKGPLVMPEKVTPIVPSLRHQKLTVPTKIKTVFDALLTEDPEILKLTLKTRDVNERGDNRTTPILTACGMNNLELVKILIENGADLTLKDNQGMSVLHIAARVANNDLVTLLVENGATSATMNKARKSPIDILHEREQALAALMSASRSGNTRGIATIFKNWPELLQQKKWPDGCTPLHAAAETGSARAVEALLQWGFGINAVDSEGRTPLICAAQKKRFRAAKFLLEHGADPAATDSKGHTAFQIMNE